MYGAWPAGLPEHVDICAIQLPGRGRRLLETPLDDMGQLIGQLNELLCRYDDVPFALFGHSLGALMGFELAHELRRRKAAMPAHLFVSGCEPPRKPRPSWRPWHDLGADELIARLAEFNGTPPEVLANQELMALLLPGIRADFRMAARYTCQGEGSLALPITALAGRDDAIVAKESVQDWAAETTGSFRLHWFDGGHFFIDTARREVLRILNAECSDARGQ